MNFDEVKDLVAAIQRQPSGTVFAQFIDDPTRIFSVQVYPVYEHAYSKLVMRLEPTNGCNSRALYITLERMLQGANDGIMLSFPHAGWVFKLKTLTDLVL